MSKCLEFESSMTGSSRAGPLKPPVNSSPIHKKNLEIQLSFSGCCRPDKQPIISSGSNRSEQKRMLQKMTPVRPHSSQPIQLTPLWEHVVRTRRFPSEVDTRETFDEISERLRDPEWQVRQHALRVLVDVLPTLDLSLIDDAMTSVLPELVNNLGHLAPAVRKGALDTLRVYLLCTRKRDDIVRGILNEGLSKQDTLDNIQSNISLGVILSTPSLLFPSSNCPRPSDEIIRQAIGALTNRLVQVTHQEASLRSLVKIEDFLGREDFDFFIKELDMNAKRDYEILCEVYKIKSSSKEFRKKSGKKRGLEIEKMQDSKNSEENTKNCDCQTEISGNVEKFENSVNSSATRIVLETEIKFNEETAITMTIIEQKDEHNDRESDFDSSDELSKNPEEDVPLAVENDNELDNDFKDDWIERRKTPRRVHFGGEIVKLRTPDSDDSEIVQMHILQSKIPVPISPQTKIITVRSRKSRSNPSSPNLLRSRSRKSKSVSNSPKREFYTHDASLSPKKSILTKTLNNSGTITARTNEESQKNMEARVDTIFGKQEKDDDSCWAFEIFDNDDLPNSANADFPKDSIIPKNNRDSNKKRNFAKTNSERSVNNEIGKTKIEPSSNIDSNLNNIVENRDLSTESANFTTDRESTNKNTDFRKMNDKIGKNSSHVSTIDEIPISITPDSEKITKKSASPKKKRNSAKTKIGKQTNEGISKNETNTSSRVEHPNHSIKNPADFTNDSIPRKTDSRKNSIDSKNEIDTAIKNIDSPKTNERARENIEIGKVEASVELVKASPRITFETLNQVIGEEKQDKREAKGNDTKSASLENRNKHEEKFESTLNERNGKSYSMENRTSPRKLDFETFPRKERNYILMELSSPVKTNLLKNSENPGDETIEDQKPFQLSVNNVSLSRKDSPVDPALDHLSLNLAKNSKDETFQFSENPNNDEIKEKNAENEMAPEEIKQPTKLSNFDFEESPLNDIVISEPTKFRESNWEDLGLVDQEVLDDLHNKDDWRARVRGLERVASALRTSSALIAIEPRLGSLLQAVLGGERSCRVAAAGMAVARVVVAGVSEEALKRRLPQVAWGLARQGGPNAAQLARVAMLRLRPALLLEQLLQPHCIKARNAKTRENALQLLIFSLVTFPSTEFKVENVAYKVASMVGDRRRRVRQAALDTLAVLAQIYEPEEIMKAGKLAGKGQQDGDAMLAAIRARLARKSLPMVSADGLVLYGLQISPTIQIATGPDVDWIVAGSGSVSPGTGRTRGQIIATTTRQGGHEKNAKNEITKNGSKGVNFVALGVGMETKREQKKPLAWQLVQHSAQRETRRDRDKCGGNYHNDEENFIAPEKSDGKTKLIGTLRQYRSAIEGLDDSFEINDPNPIFLVDDKDVIMKQRQTEDNFHRRMDEIYAERTGIGPISQEMAGNRLESRIPVPQSRERETNGKETTRYGAATINPRRRLAQEGNHLQNWSAGSRVSDISRPQSTHRDDHSQTEINSQRYSSLRRDSSPQHLSPTRDTYRSIYRQGRGFADGNVYREVQTAPTTTSYDVTRRRQSLKDSMATRYIADSRKTISDESQTSTNTTAMSNNDESTRFLRNFHEERSVVGNTNFYKGDKNTIEEEEHNEINKRHFAVQANSYKIQNSNDRSSQCPARIDNGTSETSSNESSNVFIGGYERSNTLEVQIRNDRNSIGESFDTENNETIVTSPMENPAVEKSFDVITHETNPSRRNSIDYGISSRNVRPESVVYASQVEIGESETEKDSSGDEENSIIPRTNSSHENSTEIHDYDNNESSDNEAGTASNVIGRNFATTYVTDESNSSEDCRSKISQDSPNSNESHETEVENLRVSKSPAILDSLYAVRSIEAIASEYSSPSTDENDGPEITTISYVREYPDQVQLESGIEIISPHVELENLVRSDIPRRESRGENVVSIIVASRPHSRNNEDKVSIDSTDFQRNETPAGTWTENFSPSSPGKLDESTNKSISAPIATNEKVTIQNNFSPDSTIREKINRSSNTGNDCAPQPPGLDATREASTSEKSQVQKRIGTSRISRMRQKSRTNMAARVVAPMQPSGQRNERNISKSKTLAQQCFSQLESNDWEITVKGLKGLSQLARQEPDQLDACAPGGVGRLLGRHVRNLRSQVSRAACLAAGDVFRSQARCIDQDLDDIAGPLLHRTADTNKFLRADSNEALDRMVEHLPPNKTVVVIVHRGATHQNAIVRATTARLLAAIVDRVGPEGTMSMPRDVREKLMATGAKLLMDGNLEARNQAKRMFGKLSRCEVFRKVLRDSVPEATLRHIDKTLRSL